ncbi:MAG: glycosyltransferase family 2 protein [Armatimonadota bacterium]
MSPSEWGPRERPLVSIGVPVYNGARYLPGTLDRLLAQDYPHLEVVVSDNASTDETPAICERYARKDRRVRYSRAARNVGLVGNFNRAFELSRGELFMWNSVTDTRHPSCVRKCVERLLAHPDAVLCYSAAQALTQDGEPQGEVLREVRGQSPDPLVRLREAIGDVDHYEAIWGVIRADALRRAGPMVANVSPDALLMAGLALLGRFEWIDEPLHFLRLRKPETWQEFSQRTLRAVRPGIGPLHRRFPATRLVLDHLWLCLRVPGPLPERLRRLRVLARAFPYVATSHLQEEWPSPCVSPLRSVRRAARRRAAGRVDTA